MANYVESLSYWYLRLNGFIPMSRFVVHDMTFVNAHGDERCFPTDCDLLAVRFPHTYEPIGGQSQDWDPDLFTGFGNGCDCLQHIVGLIVEAKGGKSRNPGNATDLQRLRRAVERLGMFQRDAAAPDNPDSQVNVVVTSVLDQGFYINPTYFIANVFIADDIQGGIEWHENMLYVPVLKIVEFVQNRMRVYAREKQQGWNFFPDDLLQFLIWHTAAGAINRID